MAACLLTPFIGGMTSLAGCVACQACTCVGSSLCTYCCGKMCGSTPSSEQVASRSARLSYFGLTLISVITAWVFRDYAPQKLAGTDLFSENMQCPPDIDTPSCMARAFVLRMVFSTTLFHLLLLLGTIGANDFANPRVVVHTGVWPIKIGLWLVLHLVPFFMPSSFFLAFGWIAFVLAVFFLLVQTIIFIEWVFDLNEAIINKDGTENVTGPWHILILVLSFLAFAMAIFMTSIGFMWFDEETETDGVADGCGLYLFFNSFNLIICFFLTLVSFRATEWMPATGIMPSMFVGCFLSFKMLSALFAQTHCNEFVAMDSMYTGPPEMIPAVTIIIAVVMMGYASVTISASKSFSGDGGSPKKGGSNLGPDGMMQEREVPLVSLDQVSVDPASTENTMNNEDDEKTGVQLSGPVGYNIAAFHFAFMLGMCYVGMQLTNWNEDFAKGSVDKGSTSMWIKIADSWILAIAYLWAMVAPKVLSNRSFS